MKSPPAKIGAGRRHRGQRKTPHLAAGDEMAALQLELELDTLRDELSGLEESRQHYADLYDFAPVGYLSLDRQGCIHAINLTGARLLGQRRDALLGKPLLPLVAAPDRREFLHHLTQLRRGRKDVTTELRLGLRPPHVAAQLISVQYEKKRPLAGFRTAIVDLTERKQAAAALSESEGRFRQMADSAPVLIWVAGPDKSCTYFNRGWLDFTGRTLAHEIGNGWAVGVHPDDRARCMQIYSTAFDGRRSFQMEYRLRRHDGQYRWLLDHGVPRFASPHEFLGYIGSCVDITERRSSEVALRTAAAQLRLVTDTAPVMIKRCSRDLRYLFVNRAYANFVGRESHQIVGKLISEVLTEAAYKLILPYIETVLAGQAVEFETEWPDASGRPRLRHSAYSPELDAAGTVVGWVAAITDITQSKLEERRTLTCDAITRGLVVAATDREAATLFLQTLCEQTGWDVGALWLVNPSGGRMNCVGFWQRPDLPVPEFEADTRQRSFTCGSGVMGKVWSTGEIAFMPELAQEPDFQRAVSADLAGLRSGICFPMKTGIRVLGLIECYSRSRRELDGDFLDLLTAASDKLGQFLERKQAEEAIRLSEERLRCILEAALDAIITLDGEGNVTGWNPRAGDLFGWTPPEAIGRKLVELIIPPRYRATYDEGLQNYVNTGRSQLLEKHFEFVAIHRNGSEFPVEVAISPLVLQDRLAFSVFVQDITARKQVEEVLRRSRGELEQHVKDRTIELTEALEALRVSETRFRGFVESAPDAIVIADKRGRIVLVNAQTERLFGYTRQELERQPMERLLPERFRRRHRSQRLRYMAEPSVPPAESGLELSGLRKDGREFPIEIKLSSLPAPNSRLICGAIRDITDRKQVEQALQEGKEHYLSLFKEARAAQLEARRLSTLVLHAQEKERKRISRELHDEVGQSLTAINMAVTALKRNAAGDPGLQMIALDDIQQIVERTMKAVHGFARELRPSMLDELGLLPALRSHLKNLAARTGLSVSLRADSGVEDLGEEEKLVLFRVAQESLNNVVKHAKASRVELTVRKTERGIRLSVEDNGKSFHLKSNGAVRGQRLGLLGMRERVRLVNGRFAIIPRPGKGTKVWVAIPFKPELVQPAVPSQKRDSNAKLPVPGRSELSSQS